MKNKIIALVVFILIILIFVLSFLFFNKKEDIETVSIEEVTREWIEKNSPTYKFDGFDLKLLDAKITNCTTCFEFTYSFFSNSAGYGDRSNDFTAQVIIEHIIVLNVEKGVIISAITDGVFSELDNKIIRDVEDLKKEKFFLYFLKTENNSEEIVRVEREGKITESIEKTALNELLKGLTEDEKNLGYFTSINEGVLIQSFEIENGVVLVDFSKELEKEVGGSARVIAIRSQIEETLKQFNNINQVIISIDGRIEDILQP